ncbi:hypothetical protein Dimus_015886 [Dionaea muscipula]
MGRTWWERREFAFILVYAAFFYAYIIRRSLQLSHDYHGMLHGLRPGWIGNRLNDVSDAQWRSFRGNLPILTAVFGAFTLVAVTLRTLYHLKAHGMAVVWLLISLVYLLYLHGVCIIFILLIASLNFVLVKVFARTKYFLFLLWTFNIFFLVCNRVYEGYSFSFLGHRWAYLDDFRGTFRWHICFNFVTLRMISFGYDYHWSFQDSHFDQKKHIRGCSICKSGRTCYFRLQENSLQSDRFFFTVYLCYLVYAPLYIAGPIVGFNAFASQLDLPQNTHLPRDVVFYGLRWAFALFLVELMTHFCYYNAFALSDMWKQLSAVDVFIIGYGVLNFMWLKFLLIWRYFRLWSLINGLDCPENMPKCINNCYNLESFWKNWHASYNKWLVRYMYIPLGGTRTKVLNVWIIFTFVAVWHDLEWKLLSWAWLTCVFFVPEMLLKSAAGAFQVESTVGKFVYRELRAVAGAVTITCLMIANLVGFVIGPSGINWLFSCFLHKEGIPILGGMLFTFYLGTKLMFHIGDANQTMSRMGK